MPMTPGKRHFQLLDFARQRAEFTTADVVVALGVKREHAAVIVSRAVARGALQRMNRPGVQGYVYSLKEAA